MTQKLKLFQKNIENNKSFFIAIILFSILFPCINTTIFLSGTIIDIPIYDLLWIAFYSIILNIILFQNHTLWRIVLIGINITSMFLWYFVSIMGGIRGILLSLSCSVIPFFPHLINLLR